MTPFAFGLIAVLARFGLEVAMRDWRPRARRAWALTLAAATVGLVASVML